MTHEALVLLLSCIASGFAAFSVGFFLGSYTQRKRDPELLQDCNDLAKAAVKLAKSGKAGKYTIQSLFKD